MWYISLLAICNEICAYPTIFYLASKPSFSWGRHLLWGSQGLIRLSITVKTIINGCHRNHFVFSNNLKLDHGKITHFTLHIHTLTAIISIFFYMVELQGAEKPIFRNYRHFVSQCPVNTLHWLPNFSLTRHGLTQTKVHSLAKWIALSGKRTVIACVAIEVHDHNTTAPYYIYNKDTCQVILLLYKNN